LICTQVDGTGSELAGELPTPKNDAVTFVDKAYAGTKLGSHIMTPADETWKKTGIWEVVRRKDFVHLHGMPIKDKATVVAHFKKWLAPWEKPGAFSPRQRKKRVALQPRRIRVPTPAGGIPKPRSRPPSGATWDYMKGVWVRPASDGPTLDKGKTEEYIPKLQTFLKEHPDGGDAVAKKVADWGVFKDDQYRICYVDPTRGSWRGRDGGIFTSMPEVLRALTETAAPKKLARKKKASGASSRSKPKKRAAPEPTALPAKRAKKKVVYYESDQENEEEAYVADDDDDDSEEDEGDGDDSQEDDSDSDA
jgi:hypothetical protein